MEVHVAASRSALGHMAARDIAASLRALLARQEHVRIVLAAAPSQSEMLGGLRSEPEIDWKRVTAFHMDEYIGLPNAAPQRFSNWLRREFVNHVPLARFEPINPAGDPQSTCDDYANLLAAAPIDMVLLGIGTNGHVAFNDPPANLSEPEFVKVVTLDAMCREQQVQDGCFPSLEHVPLQAITLTVPALLGGRELFCCVPGLNKSAAVRATLESEISGECPATALRIHPCCHLYLDHDSISKVQNHERFLDRRP